MSAVASLLLALAASPPRQQLAAMNANIMYVEKTRFIDLEKATFTRREASFVTQQKRKEHVA